MSLRQLSRPFRSTSLQHALTNLTRQSRVSFTSVAVSEGVTPLASDIERREVKAKGEAPSTTVPNASEQPQRVKTKAEIYTDPDTYAPLRKPIAQCTTIIPQAFYCDEWHKLEKEKIWENSWVCVGTNDKLQNPGDTFLAKVAGQSIIVTKDKSGKIQAFHNCCRHRAATLVQKDGKYRGFRCPYHSWTYTLEGRLVSTPMFPDVPKDDYGLLKVNADTWGGFIFLNLQEKPVRTLQEHLGDIPMRSKNHHHDSYKTVAVKEYVIKANWKLIAENFLDYYHLPWVHKELVKSSAVENHVLYQGPGEYMGFATSPLAVGGTVFDADFLPPVKTLTPREKESSYFYHIFPNISIFMFPSHTFALIPRPSDEPGKEVTETKELAVLMCHEDSMQDEDFESKIQELFERYDVVNKEDIEAVEQIQNGITAKDYKGGLLHPEYELATYRYQNMIADYMLADDGVKDVTPADMYMS